MRRLLARWPLGALLILGAACGVGSPSFKDSAEDVIEDDERTAENFEGRTFDDALCEEPVNNDVGTRFNCTATDTNGLAAAFVATITADDEFEISQPQDVTGGAATTVVSDPSASTTPAPVIDPAASTTTPAPPTS